MRYIEGNDRKQIMLFPEVVDDYISEENPVRVIDAYIDSLNMRELGIGATSNETGRPPYHPKDMSKLYLYGYFNRLRSSRKLEAETHRNIELMWLINNLKPDHKTIARFRKDNAKALKSIFRDFVQLCKKLGLYGKELVAIDGSKFGAVNAKGNNYNHEKLEDKLRRIDEKLERYLRELDENDQAEVDSAKHSKEEIAAAILELTERKQGYEDLKKKLEESGETQISTTDPDAKRMKQANGGSDISFNVQTAVDAKHKLIVDYEVTNRCNDKNLLAPMAKSAKEALGVDELAAAADTGYFVASDIAECMAAGITPHVASEHKSVTFCVPAAQAEAAEPEEFSNPGKNVFIRDRNVGLCPMGCFLYPQSYSKKQHSAIYRNSKACGNCPRKSECTTNNRRLMVQMPESKFSTAYDEKDLYVKQITYSPDKKLLRKRKEIVEHPFGTTKRHMNSAYCLLKGIPNVRGEFALTFLVYNMKRAIKIIGAAGLLQAIKGNHHPPFSEFSVCCAFRP